MNNETEKNKKIIKPETKIRDGMGNIHDAYYCGGHHFMCPYVQEDIYGGWGCVTETYLECDRHD